MSAFYQGFREHVLRRHPHCADLLRLLEQNGAHAKPDLESLLADLHGVLAIEQGLALLGGDGSDQAKHVETARELRGYLDAFIISRCEQFERDRSAAELRTLLALRSLGPLWIFSTNYDRIIEEACEANGVTWSDGFEVACPRAVADWKNEFETEVRIVKLHGSVNWYQDVPGGSLHRLDRGYALPAHDFRLLRGTQQLRPLMIIPTLEKQALGDPFIGLSMQFTDVLKDARLLIVAGSSLRDQHIRAFIKGRMRTLHVLLISPSASKSQELLDFSEHTHVLDSGFSELLVLGGTSLADLGKAVVAAGSDAEILTAAKEFVSRMSRNLEDEDAIQTSPVLSALWKALGSERAAARIEAVKALRSHSHPAITRRVLELAKRDPHPAVRIAAIDALLDLAGADATETFGIALADDTFPDVQLEAALALATMKSSRAGSLLAASLARPDIPSMLKKTIEIVQHDGAVLEGRRPTLKRAPNAGLD
jgi:hypothetical protein